MMSLFNPHTASAGHYYCALLSIYVNLLNMSLYISQSDEMRRRRIWRWRKNKNEVHGSKNEAIF